MTDFMKIMQALKDAYSDKTLSPVALGNRREELLCQGLQAVAVELGAKLKKPMRIDSRGEIAILAEPTGTPSCREECGRYGERFAELLNPYQPRTGIYPTAIMIPENGWCYMNHFNVEKMLTEYHNRQLSIAETTP